MERIIHGTINVNKPQPTEIVVSKPTPNLVTEAFVIEKPRHIEVVVAKGSTGVNGRNGVNGRDGRDGTNGTDGIDGIDGKDGGVFIPSINEGMLSWSFSDTAEGSHPAPTNVFANIESITNLEIFNVVNGD